MADGVLNLVSDPALFFSVVATGENGENGVFNKPVKGLTVYAVGDTGSDASADISTELLSLVAYGDNLVSLPAFTVNGQGLTGTNSNLLSQLMRFNALTVSAIGLTENGGVGSADLSAFIVSIIAESAGTVALPPLFAIAQGTSGNDGVAIVYIPPLSGAAIGFDLSNGNANIAFNGLQLVANALNGSVGVLDKSLPSITIATAGFNGATGAASIQLPLLKIASTGFPQIIGSASISLPALSMISNAIALAIIDNALAKAYCINLQNLGLTSYSNYAFNSFATFNNQALAANDTGLYSLTGATDNATPIMLDVLMGNNDYGSDKQKRMDALYVAYRTTGDLKLSVKVDDNETFDYRLETQGWNGVYNNRVKLGKGMKGRYYQIGFTGTGVQFELDSLEANPVELSRKL